MDYSIWKVRVKRPFLPWCLAKELIVIDLDAWVRKHAGNRSYKATRFLMKGVL